MDRSTGTPLGFALVVLLAIGFGWALLGGGEHHTATALSSFGTSSSVSADFAAEQAQPALVWPQEMPEPMTNYVGRRVNAFGLRVTSVDADEGFWVEKDGRTAWIQILTPTESPYTVLPGQTVSLSGSVYPHDPRYPSEIFFCPDRQASAVPAGRGPHSHRDQGGQPELRHRRRLRVPSAAGTPDGRQSVEPSTRHGAARDRARPDPAHRRPPVGAVGHRADRGRRRGGARAARGHPGRIDPVRRTLSQYALGPWKPVFDAGVLAVAVGSARGAGRAGPGPARAPARRGGDAAGRVERLPDGRRRLREDRLVGRPDARRATSTATPACWRSSACPWPRWRWAGRGAPTRAGAGSRPPPAGWAPWRWPGSPRSCWASCCVP